MLLKIMIHFDWAHVAAQDFQNETLKWLLTVRPPPLALSSTLKTVRTLHAEIRRAAPTHSALAWGASQGCIK